MLLNMFRDHLSLSPAAVANATILVIGCTALLGLMLKPGVVRKEVTLLGRLLMYTAIAFGYFAAYEILIDYFPGMMICFGGFFLFFILAGLSARASVLRSRRSHPN